MIVKLKSLGVTVLTGEDIGADFCHDEYPGGDYVPMAVVEAMSADEVSKVLKLCYENETAITVRGAGTGQVGGSVAIEGGIVLSVKGMTKVIGYDEASAVLTVEAGMLLQDVKAEAAKYAMQYPMDPGELTATIGGNVATNAAGPGAVKYGRTGDYVVDAKLVMADGTVASLDGKKDVIGSEGTLAVITEVSLKLVPKVAADAILLLPFMDFETAVTACKAVLDADYSPSILELMDTDIVELSGKVTGNPVFPVEMEGERVGATLMMTLEAEDDDAVMEKMEGIAGLWEEGEIECLDILVGDTVTMKRDFWAAHAAFHTSMESGVRSAREINITVPMEGIAQMMDYAKACGEKVGISVYQHAHVKSGGMHIHVGADMSKDELSKVFTGFADEVYAKCSELDGDVGGEYGIGYAKKAYVSAKDKAAFVDVKAQYDPKGILNPGKIV